MSDDLILNVFPSPVLVSGGARFRKLWRVLPWGLFVAALLPSWELFSRTAAAPSAQLSMVALSAVALSLVFSFAAASYFIFTSVVPAHDRDALAGRLSVSWRYFYWFEALVGAAAVAVLWLRFGVL